MLLTTTLNTSVDKCYLLDSPLNIGEVTRVKSALENAGGKGLNAARAIQTFGEEVIATGLVGGNNGQTIVDILNKQHVKHAFTQVKNQTRCSINVIDSNGISTELLEPGEHVSKSEIKEFEHQFLTLLDKVDVATLNGSMPKGFEPEYYKRLITFCNERNIPCFIDTSGKYLIEAIKAKPFFIKPNTDEVAQLLGHKPTSIEEIVESAKVLHSKGIAKVAITLGSQGAILVTDSGVYKATPPNITCVNPVGSGDTFTGVFAACISRNMTDEQCLANAIACASANCVSEQTGVFDMDVAEELIKEITITKLS